MIEPPPPATTNHMIEIQRDADRAIELDASNATARMNLGWVHLQQNNLSEAANCYQSALEVGPLS